MDKFKHAIWVAGVCLGLASPAALVAQTPATAQAPKPGESEQRYPLMVRVESSRLDRSGHELMQYLYCTIGGRKYELLSAAAPVGFMRHPALLAPGLYRARVATENRRGVYLRYTVYELLMPDNSHEKFQVTGESLVDADLQNPPGAGPVGTTPSAPAAAPAGSDTPSQNTATPQPTAPPASTAAPASPQGM